MRIVICDKDLVRHRYDAKCLVYGQNSMEFESDGITYFVDLNDVSTVYISEDFAK